MKILSSIKNYYQDTHTLVMISPFKITNFFFLFQLKTQNSKVKKVKSQWSNCAIKLGATVDPTNPQVKDLLVRCQIVVKSNIYMLCSIYASTNYTHSLMRAYSSRTTHMLQSVTCLLFQARCENDSN